MRFKFQLLRSGVQNTYADGYERLTVQDPYFIVALVHNIIGHFSGSQRALVMIGDAEPHSPEDYPNLRNKCPAGVVGEAIDWRKEADELVKMVSVVVSSMFIYIWGWFQLGTPVVVKGWLNLLSFYLSLSNQANGT